MLLTVHFVLAIALGRHPSSTQNRELGHGETHHPEIAHNRRICKEPPSPTLPRLSEEEDEEYDINMVCDRSDGLGLL